MVKLSDEEEVEVSRSVCDKLFDYEEMPFCREDVKGVSVIVSGDEKLLGKSCAGPENLIGAMDKIGEFMAALYVDPKSAAKAILETYERWEGNEKEVFSDE